MILNKEIWKEIDNLPKKYYISNKGNIKNNKGKILKPFFDKDGYKCIRLTICGNSYCRKIHRLVAQAFIPNPENKPFINHLNGVKDDNRVQNLQWVTGSENSLHSCYILGNNIKTVYQFDIFGNFIKEWISAEIVAKELNCCANNITKVCLGKHRTCRGYIWSYNRKLEKEKLNFQKRYRIYQYDLLGNLIKIYNSIKEAKEETKINNISTVCSHRQKTAGGYIWKYESEVIENGVKI